MSERERIYRLLLSEAQAVLSEASTFAPPTDQDELLALQAWIRLLMPPLTPTETTRSITVTREVIA